MNDEMEMETEAQIDLFEFIINRESYLLIKPEFGGSWHTICVNAGRPVCDGCQQEQCNWADGGMPDPDDYEWSVVKREQEDRWKECDYCDGHYNQDTFKTCPFCDEGCEEK